MSETVHDVGKEIRAEIEAIYKHRGIENCAAAMGVARPTAYCYQQPPTDNGRVIPLCNLVALYDDVTKSKNIEAQKAAFRSAQHIVKHLNAAVVDKRLLKACGDGLPYIAIHPEVIPPELTEICPKCDDPVRYLPVCSCRWSKR